MDINPFVLGFSMAKKRGGGSGGGSIVIDVTELPTENVDDTKIYRMTTEAEPIIWIAGKIGSTDINMSLADFIAMSGANVVLNVKGVFDTLPDVMEQANVETGYLPCYVLKSTGIAYASTDGSSANAMKLGELLGGVSDYGWVDSVENIETPATLTMYTVRGGVRVVYGTPNDNGVKDLYEYTSEKGWVEVYHPTFETLDATANGAYTPDEADGFSSVNVNIVPVTETLSVTKNGTYVAPDGVDGYSSVNVNVVDTTLTSLLQAGATNITELSLPGVTELRSYAFAYSEHPIRTLIAPDLKKIGARAFDNMKNLAITSLPDGVTEIGNFAFDKCYKLALSSLPEGLTKIGNIAFEMCYLCTFTSLPSTLTFVGQGAFQYCEGLTTITFNSKPTTVGINAFYHCSNLTDIYVPWAEGEVSGAPWEATNATIHYNYTGG